ADAPAEDLRRGRAAAANIVPQASRSTGMLAALLPELGGRISASALNVPAYNASAVDLVCWHERDASVEQIPAPLRPAPPPPPRRLCARLAGASRAALGARLPPALAPNPLCGSPAGSSSARRALELAERLEEAEAGAP